MKPGETYLGDAVYASYDGWQICLRTGDGNNQCIYLEPAVLDALYRYAEKLEDEAEKLTVAQGDGT